MSIDETYKSALFQIEADQRSSGTESDFIFDLGMSQKIQQAKKIVLKSVIFPNVFYNITTSNNTLQVKYLADPYVNVSVEPGYYTASELGDALASAIVTALGPPLTMTITPDQIKGKLVFEVTNVGGAITINSTDALSTLVPNLGLDPATLLIVDQVVGPETAPFIAQLAGLTSINIHSRTLSGNNYLEENNRIAPVLMNVPITVPFLGVNVYESQDDELNSIVYDRSRSIQAIDIRITDRQSNTLDLQKHNIKILCKVYYR